MTRIVIIGGGPAGYEAALVAAQLGADVTLVERDGVGGACVLSDCVPSKTFIASAGVATGRPRRRPRLHAPTADAVARRPARGSTSGSSEPRAGPVRRHRAPASSAGRALIAGHRRARRRPRPVCTRRGRPADGGARRSPPTSCSSPPAPPPASLPDAEPDGERILTWRQLYDLAELPEHLVVVGSGVTGAEFASAYVAMGVEVTLVSSRDRVLPGEDADAAAVLQDVFAERGMEILAQARADVGAPRRRRRGGHAGRRPHGRGLARPDDGRLGAQHRRAWPGEGRRRRGRGGFIDGRPGVAHLRAGHLRGGRLHRRAACSPPSPRCRAGSRCGTRWARRVMPLRLQDGVAATCSPTRRSPRSASASARSTRARSPARTVMLPLSTNARAKMQGLRRRLREAVLPPGHRRGRRRGGGGAGGQRADPADRAGRAERADGGRLAYTFSVYPSLSGSITEAGRQLMRHGDLD